MQPICTTCGGAGVRVAAWACRDVDAPRSALLHSTYEAAATCADCDVECSYARKTVAERGLMDGKTALAVGTYPEDS